MKKLFLLATVLVATFALASLAFAAPKQFEHFSAEVPDGWKVTEVDGAVNIASPDGNSHVTVSVQPLAGKSLKDAANEFAAEVGGTVTPDAQGYAIEFKDGVVYVMEEEGNSYAIMIVGDDPALEGVLDSIQ